jgi:hypothetical protein
MNERGSERDRSRCDRMKKTLEGKRGAAYRTIRMLHFATSGNLLEAPKNLKLLAISTQPSNMHMLKTNFIYLPLDFMATTQLWYENINT